MLSDAFRLLEFPPEVYNFKYWHEIGWLKEKSLYHFPTFHLNPRSSSVPVEKHACLLFCNTVTEHMVL